MLLFEKVCISKIDPSLTSTLNPNSCNSISSCVVPELNLISSYFRVQVNLQDYNRNALVAVIVDCGMTALFINAKFVKKNKIQIYCLL